MSKQETDTDGESPSPARRRRRLKSLANVRTGLADVIRALEDDLMDAGKARALIYAYATLSGVIQGSDLEQRIARLEGFKPGPTEGVHR